MNKPAAKEPSMDEILSSIRQIIADDDAAGAPAPPRAPIAAAPAPAPRPVTPSPPARLSEPLALSAAQIVPSPRPRPPVAEAPPPAADFSSMLAGLDEPETELSSSMEEMLAEAPELVDPEDIAFEPELEPEPVMVAPPPPPVMRAPEPAWAPEPSPSPPPRAAAVSHAAPMPDPMLSSDMAEELLAPTTNAAVQGTMARLSAISEIGTGGQTIEGMMRDLMRPMLKEWLDENLPALVERVVEKEIVRISRGAR